MRRNETEGQQRLPTGKAASSASPIQYLLTYHVPGKEGNTGPVRLFCKCKKHGRKNHWESRRKGLVQPCRLGAEDENSN